MNNSTPLTSILVADRSIYHAPGPADHRWPGTYGIELELESVGDIMRDDAWGIHDDGSLRNGIEYVTQPAMGGDTLVQALDTFYEFDHGASASPRTSTHIHVGMADATVGNVRSLLALVYVLETGLYDIIGVDRKWAGYSMPLYEMGSDRLRSLLSQETPQHNFTSAVSGGNNAERYYGLNVASLSRHGTVEFRYFPGGPSRDELESWLDLVAGIKKMAMTVSLESLASDIIQGEQLFSLYDNFLPAPFMTALRGVVSPEQLLAALHELLAIAEVDSSMQRQETLVFLSDFILEYVIRTHNIQEEGQALLRRAAEELAVVTSGDWLALLSRAKNTSPIRATLGGELFGLEPPAWIDEGDDDHDRDEW